MIYITEVEGKFISGIFKRKRNLTSFVSKMSPKSRANNHIYPLKFTYPFFIIETFGKRRNFLFTQHAENVFDNLYFLGAKKKKATVYKITEDFKGNPDKPGEDYMGILDHSHFEEGDGK